MYSSSSPYNSTFHSFLFCSSCIFLCISLSYIKDKHKISANILTIHTITWANPFSSGTGSHKIQICHLLFQMTLKSLILKSPEYWDCKRTSPCMDLCIAGHQIQDFKHARQIQFQVNYIPNSHMLNLWSMIIY